MQEAKVHIYRSSSLVALCCNLNLQAKCPDDNVGLPWLLYEPEGKTNIFSKVSLGQPSQIKPNCHYVLELVFPQNSCKFWLCL